MTTYYVKNGGNDSLNGLSDANAWETLSKVNGFSFNAGDIIQFKRGSTWSGLLNITRSGSSGSPITYQDYSTGNAPIIQNSGDFSDCVNVNANYVTIKNFKFQNAAEAGIDVHSGYAAQYLTVSYCEFYNLGCGFRSYNMSNSVIEHCNFHDLKMIHNDVGGDDDYGANGIIWGDSNTYNHVRYSTFLNCKAPSYDYGYDGGFLEFFGNNISNNHIYGNWVENCQGAHEAGSDNAADEMTNNNIHHNIFVNNGTLLIIHTSGSGFPCNWHGNYVYNNSVYETVGNGAWIIEWTAGTSDAGKCYFRNNIVWMDTTGGGSWQRVASDHNFTHEYNTYNTVGFDSGLTLGTGEYDDTDPKWVNKGSDDFHLASDSPCIDNALDAGFTSDYEESLVPQGDGPDRGALEYDEGAVLWGASAPSGSATAAAAGRFIFSPTAALSAAATAAAAPLVPGGGGEEYEYYYDLPPSHPLAHYEVWVLNGDYTKRAMLPRYINLTYKQTLDGVGFANVEVDPTCAQIPDMQTMKRLLIQRNGEIVFLGLILYEHFKIPGSAPTGESWSIAARDCGCYFDWRVTVPPANEEYDKRGPDHADDVLKSYVRAHCGTGAIAERQISDLAVVADLHAGPNLTYEARNIILTTVLKNISLQSAVHWRVMPNSNVTGVEFRTYYPLYGIDRSRGNGVNDECVFSLDRRNFSDISYVKDTLEHYNYIYVWGQGEGVERLKAEGEDATARAFYKRRERYADARHVELEMSLADEIPGYIEEYKVIRAMTVAPHWWTWKNDWDLGDIVTIEINHYGNTFSYDGMVMAVEVDVDRDGSEDVKPELEGV